MNCLLQQVATCYLHLKQDTMITVTKYTLELSKKTYHRLERKIKRKADINMVRQLILSHRTSKTRKIVQLVTQGSVFNSFFIHSVLEFCDVTVNDIAFVVRKALIYFDLTRVLRMNHMLMIFNTPIHENNIYHYSDDKNKNIDC